MRYPREYYQMLDEVGRRFTDLPDSQQRGLALWVYGTILAGSACQNSVVTALLPVGGEHALRQYLREWLYDGKDKAAPCHTQVDDERCFAAVMRWVLEWWQGRDLPLAIDAVSRGDEVVGLAVSVLYRGCAIPVGCHMLPANQEGAWMGHILRLLRLLRREIPSKYRVLVMTDRGLWSPRLWKRIRDLGWHPLPRLQSTITCQPVGQKRVAARILVPGPGHAWVGRATVFKDRQKQRVGTLMVVWGPDEKEPWVLLTDLPPEKVGVWWYSLRVWIELGFRALKGVGWQWQKTRRTDPDRLARHWVVLAVAMVWTLAYGTRAEDAELRGVQPADLRAPPKPLTEAPRDVRRRRQISVFAKGLTWLRKQLSNRWLWRRLWLVPEPWPEAPPGLTITYHQDTNLAVA